MFDTGEEFTIDVHNKLFCSLWLCVSGLRGKEFGERLGNEVDFDFGCAIWSDINGDICKAEVEIGTIIIIIIIMVLLLLLLFMLQVM